MKKFLSYTIKILALSYGIAFILQIIADNGLKANENSIYNDWDGILQGEINSELVILGSSRGAVNYDPEIIEKHTGFSSFNLSYNEGSYNLQKLKFDIYLSKNQNPKIVIQNVDLSHFTSTNAIPAKYQFLSFLNDQALVYSLREIDKDFGNFNFIPLAKYSVYRSLFIEGILSYFGKNSGISFTKKGFTPHNKDFERDNQNLKRLKQADKNDLSRYTVGLNFTNNLLQNNVPKSSKLFLVWAPEFKERLYLNAPARKFVKNELEQLALELPNVYFIDLSHDPISKDKEYFYDTFHLNQKGAKLFSKKVALEINNILRKNDI